MGEFEGLYAPGFHRLRLSGANLPSTTPTHSLFNYECQENASIGPKAQSRKAEEGRAFAKTVDEATYIMVYI